MNIRHSLLGLFLPLSLFSCHTVEKEAVGRPLSSYVNPFVGASTNTELAGASHGLGKTFPGATAPFGMVQVSPNTITGGDNGPGYSYEHTTIEGFAFTQMSGIGWYGDLGNFLVMPTIGDLHTFAGTEDKPEEGYRSRYDKSTEKASAGYYSVFLSDYKIQAEATALPHSGMLRFTFPENEHSYVVVDAFDKGSYIKVIPEENKVIGYTTKNSGGVTDNLKKKIFTQVSRKGVTCVNFWQLRGEFCENLTNDFKGSQLPK